MISVKKLCKEYRGLQAIHGLDLEIAAGDCFGLIGPNGAGKTTLMRILATLLDPSDGMAWIDGWEVAESPEQVNERVGYLADTFPVYGELRVWEFLDYHAGCHRIPRRERRQRVDAVLDLVDLRGKRNEAAQHLSRGMRQRLCLGKTLIHNPKVLLLDEPTSGLDPKARIEFRQLMQELLRLGKTILISSHVLPELSGFCNAVGIMERGRMVISGRVDDILSRIQPTRVVLVDVLAGMDLVLKQIAAASAAVVEGLPATSVGPFSCVRNHRVEGRRLTIEFSGDDDALADLHQAMCVPNVRILSFAEHRRDLEDIFLRVAAHEVS